MPLNEIALEELGLAPRWVRKGARADRGQSPVEGAEALASAQAVAAPLSQREAAHDASLSEAMSNASERRAARADIASDEAGRDRPARPVSAPPVGTPAATPAPAEAPRSDDDFAWFDTGASAEPAALRDDIAAPIVAHSGVATLDWDALAERVASCAACRLCEQRTNTVFGVGDQSAEWMLIGEAPGENEDRVGEPFVGKAGKLLDNMLRALALARGDNVYIANVIKCRPPGNRNPEPDEVARCEPYLQRQVQLVKPKIIVALGRFAAQSLLKTTGSIASLRGRVHEYEGVPVIVTYHPAYLLRSLQDKSKAWTDLCLARDTWRAASRRGG
ncbi:MAG TPA: uracil-DNA glycosylase [Paraburkholderia sp.]|jgi:uracil-DNA glycosylase family 4|nr:uracil-DNA glycosylase [Paraburkholderia sp.]